MENSFQSPDSVNAVDWSLKSKNKDVFNYVKGLIAMRKQHPAFRMKTAAQIATNIKFMNKLAPGIVAYTINGIAVKDKWKKIFVIYNASVEDKRIALPAGGWFLFTGQNRINIKKISQHTLVKARTCAIFYQL